MNRNSPPMNAAEKPNPCDYDNLSGAQQGMVSEDLWGTFMANQQQMFVNVTADAAALGLDLTGLTLSGITQADVTTHIDATGKVVFDTMSEVVFSGDTTRLIAQLNGSSLFSGNQPFAHEGYPGNYRQNTAMWARQT